MIDDEAGAQRHPGRRPRPPAPGPAPGCFRTKSTRNARLRLGARQHPGRRPAVFAPGLREMHGSASAPAGTRAGTRARSTRNAQFRAGTRRHPGRHPLFPAEGLRQMAISCFTPVSIYITKLKPGRPPARPAGARPMPPWSRILQGAASSNLWRNPPPSDSDGGGFSP